LKFNSHKLFLFLIAYKLKMIDLPEYLLKKVDIKLNKEFIIRKISNNFEKLYKMSHFIFDDLNIWKLGGFIRSPKKFFVFDELLISMSFVQEYCKC